MSIGIPLPLLSYGRKQINVSHWRLRKLDLVRTGPPWSRKKSLPSVDRARFGIGPALILSGLVPGVVPGVAVDVVVDDAVDAASVRVAAVRVVAKRDGLNRMPQSLSGNPFTFNITS